MEQMENSTILIVEDDTDLREGLAFSLKSEGYLIETACTK